MDLIEYAQDLARGRDHLKYVPKYRSLDCGVCEEGLDLDRVTQEEVEAWVGNHAHLVAEPPDDCDDPPQGPIHL